MINIRERPERRIRNTKKNIRTKEKVEFGYPELSLGFVVLCWIVMQFDYHNAGL